MLKQRVRQAFDAAAESYPAAAGVQRRVAAALAARIDPEAGGTVLDAGCGTGFAGPLLAGRRPGASIIGIDLAERMLHQFATIRSTGTPAVALCGDIEHLPLATASIDLYWSSLSLQWCDLPAALAEARRVLRPGGWLAFSTLATGTYDELRQAFAGVDPYSHVLECLPAATIAEIVADAGFAGAAIEQDTITVDYPDLASLLRAIRATGASEVSGERRRGLLGRGLWRRIDAAYPRLPGGQALPLSYEVVYGVCRW